MTDKEVLKELKGIAKKLEDLNVQMNYEAKVYAAEREERERLGLTGDAAIEHYNEWMKRHGMEHLIVHDSNE